MATSIQVDFYNDTKENLTVVILGKKVDLPSLYLDNAWLTLPVAQKSYASFDYPQEMSVGVFYKNKYGVLITAGPYTANPGSHWNAVMTSEYSPLTLQEDSKSVDNYITYFDAVFLYKNNYVTIILSQTTYYCYRQVIYIYKFAFIYIVDLY